MKKLLLILLCLPMIFVSCKKEEVSISGCKDSSAVNYNYLTELENGSCIYTKALIIIKDSSGIAVPNARVVLHSRTLKEPLYNYNPDNYTNRSLDLLVKANLDSIFSQTGQLSNVFEADWTDDNGRAQFTLPIEMILNISVLKIAGNDEYLGVNVINIEKEKTTTQVVKLLNY